MADRDDTDELPTQPLPPPPASDRGRDEPTVVVSRPDDGRGESEATPAPEPRPAKFASARRRALLWDAGYCVVSGLVLLVLWASGRPVESLPDWSSLVTGIAVVVWAGILVAIAAGGVGRTATALVGLVNLLVGIIAFALGWFNTGVPTLALVVAAQVVAFGIVQVLASIRR